MNAQTDPRIDAYIAKSAEFAQPILRHLREVVHRGCPDVEETLKWSMPSFVYQKQILCGMAAFKAHCSFGFWHTGMEGIIAAHRGGEAEPAMGQFGRIARIDDLPDARTLRRWVGQAMELIESGQPSRPRPADAKAKGRTESPVPADLAALLKSNLSAATNFQKFTPGQRREYVDWIGEAKRDETRQKRLATTVTWLAEGKTRNWKYANC